MKKNKKFSPKLIELIIVHFGHNFDASVNSQKDFDKKMNTLTCSNCFDFGFVCDGENRKGFELIECMLQKNNIEGV